jgi:hypothetical protein
MALAKAAVPASEHRRVAYATGRAGDVYLCHPFLVHAAQPHRGTRPRFMAQPPLMPPGAPGEGTVGDPLAGAADGGGPPVLEAIRRGLGR